MEVFFESHPFVPEDIGVAESDMKDIVSKVEKAGGFLVEYSNPENITRRYQIISGAFISPEAALQICQDLNSIVPNLKFRFFLPAHREMDMSELIEFLESGSLLDFADELFEDSGFEHEEQDDIEFDVDM